MVLGQHLSQRLVCVNYCLLAIGKNIFLLKVEVVENYFPVKLYVVFLFLLTLFKLDENQAVIRNFHK